ncbi:MAG: YheU family protein [Congregibacter sp.]|nr:YheU family protein [Congregibacter sp.]MDP5071020.1 YheU family protein [Congregibacter sp.]
MSDFVTVPWSRVPAQQLQSLLEEYASRDGTDYGAQETILEARVGQLGAQLRSGKLLLMFDVDSEQWDIVSADAARRLLDDHQPDA